VYAFAEALVDPQMVHRQVFDEAREAAALRGVSPAPRLSATPAAIRETPPAPFADTEAVLEELGYGRAEIERLGRAGAIVRGEDAA
jgi:crotonobetainyl-CoA:carnitine CoA-transferase CaiB-like acyl-CoA transferase